MYLFRYLLGFIYIGPFVIAWIPIWGRGQNSLDTKVNRYLSIGSYHNSYNDSNESFYIDDEEFKKILRFYRPM